MTDLLSLSNIAGQKLGWARSASPLPPPPGHSWAPALQLGP